MKNFFNFTHVALAALVVCAALAVAFAAVPQAEAAGNICCRDFGEGQLAKLDQGRSDIRWFMAVEHEAVILTVSGPCGIIERTYPAGKDPSFSLEEVSPDDPNGAYTWQLRIRPVVDEEVKAQLAKARGTEEEEETFKALRRKGLLPEGPFLQTGSFQVEEGVIVDATQEEKRGLQAEMPDGGAAGAPGAELGVIGAGAGGDVSKITGKATVISGDLVVYNSICVGFDCPTSPTFGADTIRLQENNLRIHVDDTSTASSFPNQDWRLEFNSNLNGGAEYFRVIDVTAGRSIMTLEANAPSHSLYVDSGGRVGMGTQNPVLELHVVDGDTPALRLQQDTSSGFGAQTWDIAGNETSFFVRDATNGSTLPFRIFPGMPSGSLVLRDDNVGVGTTSPETELHILATGEAPTDVQFKIEANTDPAFDFEEQDSGVTWRFINNDTVLKIVDVGTGADGAEELRLDQAGNLTLTGNLVTGGGNLCDPGPCDRTFAPDYEVTPIEEHADYMWQNRHLWGVGPTPEGKPINVSKKLTGMLHELEVAHIYIERLNEGLKAKDARIAELEEAAEHTKVLEERLAAIEERLER